MRGVLLVLSLLGISFAQTQPPVWPNQYFVSGLWQIPYFNINEPINAYYDATNNRQRFDYYNGLNSYVWRWDLQTLWQVIPRIDTMTCFTSTNIGTGPLVQLLPNITGWGYQGESSIRGLPCNVWGTSVTNLNKTATYSMYVSAIDQRPVRLVLDGYNFVFGSHPDVYIMDYFVYVPSVDESVFDEPSLCSNGVHSESAGLRAKAQLARLNSLTPVETDDEFELFMLQFGKIYHGEELEYRRSLFEKRQKWIAAHNADSSKTYKVAMNHLGDLTTEERKMYHPVALTDLTVPTPRSLATEVHHEPKSISALPTYVNWVEKGAVNPPKDQGVCGSCWTFGTAGTLEGAWAVAHGNLVSLSEQQILDCSWGTWVLGNSGCDGGFAGPALQWVINNGGIATEASYPYLMVDSFCNAADKSSRITIHGYVNVTQGSEAALQEAVAAMPVAVAIDAAHEGFEYYSSGVYFEPTCKNGIDDLDHEVLAVGYGTDNGQDYWLVKNSWSTHWGDQGYIKMARNKNNMCGIATQANYPLV